MTPDQHYMFAKLRMAETEALAAYSRMAGPRRPESLWRKFRALSPRAGARRAPATGATPARAAA